MISENVEVSVCGLRRCRTLLPGAGCTELKKNSNLGPPERNAGALIVTPRRSITDYFLIKYFTVAILSSFFLCFQIQLLTVESQVHMTFLLIEVQINTKMNHLSSICRLIFKFNSTVCKHYYVFSKTEL